MVKTAIATVMCYERERLKDHVVAHKNHIQ